MVIRAEQLAELLGCPSAKAARRLATQPGFPAAVELSPGRVGWVRAEVEEWVESRKRRLPVALDDVVVAESLLVSGSRGVRRGPRKAAA
ncbi:MAG: helix-turn-helix transcriptional regulator [Microthrixaceae bacterium]